MKNAALLAASLCLLPGLARASDLCSALSVDKAQAALTEMNQLASNGVVGPYDVKMSEKNLLEMKLCQNVDDYGSFKALAENIGARLAMVQAMANNGAASQEDVDLVRSEKEMRRQGCLQIQNTAKARFNNGLVSAADVDAIGQACGLLSK